MGIALPALGSGVGHDLPVGVEGFAFRERGDDHRCECGEEECPDALKCRLELGSLAVGKSGETDPVFGDPFLRSAYAFFDLDAHTISLAQASYDSKSSSITPVGPGQAPSPTGT